MTQQNLPVVGDWQERDSEEKNEKKEGGVLLIGMRDSFDKTELDF